MQQQKKKESDFLLPAAHLTPECIHWHFVPHFPTLKKKKTLH